MESIKLSNCRCISSADISVKLNAVNIKYGPNGTGKSTIGDAIKYHGTDDLISLKPYYSDKTPMVDCGSFKNVKIYNYDYIKKFKLEKTEIELDGYKVFVQDPSIERELKKLESINELYDFVTNSDIADSIISFANNTMDGIKVNKKSKTLSRSGAQGDILKGKRPNFIFEGDLVNYNHVCEGLDENNRANWAKWIIDGNKLFNKRDCPFCAQNVDDKICNNINDLTDEYTRKNVTTYHNWLELLDDGQTAGIINVNRSEQLKNNILTSMEVENSRKLLKAFRNDVEYIKCQIEQIKQFRPLNLMQFSKDELLDHINDMKINIRDNSFVNTNKCKIFINEVNIRLDQIYKDIQNIYELVNQQQKELEKRINENRKIINDFLQLADFPYEFRIEDVSHRNASLYLIPLNGNDKDRDLDIHLSWGEMIAFTLIMFVCETASEDVDLIVLDDPILSFDKNKKYGVLRRIFCNDKFSFKGKTVLMLTHDMQPLIDAYYKFRDINVVTSFLSNEDGVISEKQIKKKDLVKTVDLYKKIANNKEYSKLVRTLALRKYFELTSKNISGEEHYQVLSNLLHARSYKNLKKIKGNVDVDWTNKEKIKVGIKNVKGVASDFDYNTWVKEMDAKRLVRNLETYEDIEKLIVARYILDQDEYKDVRNKIGEESDEEQMYLNELFHIENDYIYTLNPFEFNQTPKLYLENICNCINEVNESK